MRRFFVFIIAMAVLASCGGQSPPSSGTPPPAQPAAPAPVVIPDDVPLLYVSNEVGGTITIINAATLTPLVTDQLGKRPRGITVSPDRSQLYVALSGSPIGGPGVDEKTLPPADKKADGIGVFDVRTNKLLKVLPSGSDPETSAVSQDGKLLFVANEDTGLASVIDLNEGKVAETFKVGGEPEGTAITPDGKQLWVTSEEDSAITVVDLSARKVVKSIEVAPRPRSIAFLPDGSRAYVPSETQA